MTAETDWRPGALPPDWSHWGLFDASLDWQERGLCAQTDPEAFFPERGGSTAAAKRTCLACGVRQECLQYALDNQERFGVWGGLSERERRNLERVVQPTPLAASEVKVCTECGAEKPRTEFYRTSEGGLKTRCKACVTAAKRQAYAEQRDRPGAA